MELNIFSSNTTNSATAAVINKLNKNNTFSSSHIVIVPDRYTLSVEKEIYDKLDLKGSFNIDVVSFSRLAQKSLMLKNRFLSKEATVMLMKKVIDQNKKSFVYFNKMTFSIGFAKEMFAVVASFRNSSISKTQLLDAVEQMPDEIKDKYKDIALIYQQYEIMLKSKFFDTISRLDTLIRGIKDNSLITQSHIYVVGFNIYSQKQIDVIEQMLRYCKSVNIAAATDSGGGNKGLFPTMQINALKGYALSNDIKVNDEYYFQKLDEPFDVLHREFFAYKPKKFALKNKEPVVLFNQKNPYEEVKAVAREIIFHIREGKRYKDISVVCCNEDYRKCIADIFDRYGIPFFIDQRYSSQNSLMAKYLLAIIQVYLHNFRRENVMELIKHPYFGIKQLQAEAFENYCLEYNISFNRFLKEFSLGDYKEAEKIRKKLIDLIEGLENLSYANQICDFLMKKALDCPKLDWQENNPNYEASQQSHDKIIQLIEEINELLGAESMSLDEYYSIFTAGLNSMEMALLPQYIDSVFVGNTKESRFSENHILFIVGANQGFFPLKNQEQTIITYSDILNLKKYGLDVRPNPMESNTFEQFIATDLITKSKKLYVSASFYNLKGQPMQYGEAIKELSYFLDKEISQGITHNEFNPEQAIMYRLATPNNAFYEYISNNIPPKYRQAVREYLLQNGYKQKLLKLEDNIQTKSCSNLEDYYFKKKDQAYLTSVSQLESYFRCPYVHFLRYGLKVKEKPVPDLGVKDVGIIIHDILEYYFKNTKNRIRQLSDEQIKAEAIKAINKGFEDERSKKLYQDEFGKNILKTIRNECIFAINKLTQNVKNSKFTPTFLELSFNQDNKEFKALTIDTKIGRVSLRGKIDRVDLFGKKVVVIDYKTGSAEGKIKDVYYGNKIQLYVYLNVFINNGYQPAGVFYLPIRDGYISKKERFALQGQVDSSVESIKDLDTVFVEKALDMGQKVDSEILNLSASPHKDPEKVINKSDNKLSVEEFNNICSYVRELIKKAIDEICSGNMDKAPTEKACEYCIYSNHCPTEEKRIRYQNAVKKDVFHFEDAND